MKTSILTIEDRIGLDRSLMLCYTYNITYNKLKTLINKPKKEVNLWARPLVAAYEIYE